MNLRPLTLFSSSYIDSLFGDVIRHYLTKHLPMPGGFLATYPDFLSAGYITIIVILVALGIKLSSRANIIFVTLNLGICGFIVGEFTVRFALQGAFYRSRVLFNCMHFAFLLFLY